jgi:glycosyltransferase involved in cell wall biosynthesis
VKNVEAVSVIVPAYNEEAGVGDVVRGIDHVLTKAKIKHEILVVDDGSRDHTALRAYQAGAKVVPMGENRGYGASIKAGMRQSQYDLIAITDADGTYPIEELPVLIQMTYNADMAVGARTKPGVAIPSLRRFPKWLLGKWANYLAERKIPDLNSGLRVFRKAIALRYEGLFPNGFSFTTTITLAMECHGYIVKYRPIDYAARIGKSKIRPIHDTINFFSLVLRVVMYFKPLKIFIPLSGIIFLAAFALAANAYVQQEALPNLIFFLFVSGVQVAALGLLADLLVKRSR